MYICKCMCAHTDLHESVDSVRGLIDHINATFSGLSGSHLIVYRK